MKSDYARLLLAARELKGWEGPAETAAQLTLGGYRVSEQMMTNWKARGLSQAAYQRASMIVGCHPHWLATGEGEMRDVQKTRSQEPHEHLSQTLLLDRYQAADPATRLLIDIALSNPDQPIQDGLSPSLYAMVNMARAAIRDELNRK